MQKFINLISTDDNFISQVLISILDEQLGLSDIVLPEKMTSEQIIAVGTFIYFVPPDEIPIFITPNNKSNNKSLKSSNTLINNKSLNNDLSLNYFWAIGYSKSENKVYGLTKTLKVFSCDPNILKDTAPDNKELFTVLNKVFDFDSYETKTTNSNVLGIPPNKKITTNKIDNKQNNKNKQNNDGTNNNDISDDIININNNNNNNRDTENTIIIEEF